MNSGLLKNRVASYSRASSFPYEPHRFLIQSVKFSAPVSVKGVLNPGRD